MNSFHHQAVDALGNGLRVAARATDGTVEAIEDRSRRFVVGVQWHAETLVDLAPTARCSALSCARRAGPDPRPARRLIRR